MPMPAGLRKYWAAHRAAKKKHPSKKGGYSMHHRKKQFTIPLAIVAGFASPLGRTYSHFQGYGLMGPEGAIGEFSRIMIGVNPFDSQVAFQGWRLKYGLYPVLAGLLIHKVASMVGANRMLANAGIPLIRI